MTMTARSPEQHQAALAHQHHHLPGDAPTPEEGAHTRAFTHTHKTTKGVMPSMEHCTAGTVPANSRHNAYAAKIYELESQWYQQLANAH
jgi:hypothetical protein